jgi:hypothetical protein
MFKKKADPATVLYTLQKLVLTRMQSLPVAYRRKFETRSETLNELDTGETRLTLLYRNKSSQSSYNWKQIEFTYTEDYLADLASNLGLRLTEADRVYESLLRGLNEIHPLPDAKETTDWTWDDENLKKEAIREVVKEAAERAANANLSAVRATKKEAEPVCEICGPETDAYPAWNLTCPHMEKKNADG